MTSYDDLITARDTLRTRIKAAADCDNTDHLQGLLDNLKAVEERLKEPGAAAEGGNPQFHVISIMD